MKFLINLLNKKSINIKFEYPSNPCHKNKTQAFFINKPEEIPPPPKPLETPPPIPPPKLELLEDKLLPHQPIKLPPIPPPNLLLLVAHMSVETLHFIKDKLPTVKSHKTTNSLIKPSKPQLVDIQLLGKA